MALVNRLERAGVLEEFAETMRFDFQFVRAMLQHNEQVHRWVHRG